MKISQCYIYYSTLNKSLLYQIIGHYSIFNYNKQRDHCRYGSKKRQQIKYELGYKDLVQDHHIIPKEFRNHLFIEDIQFDVGCSQNIKIMPNLYGIEKLNLPNNTLTHYKGHNAYNQYIKKELDYLYDSTNFEESKYQFILFFYYLQYNLDYESELPWL